MNLDQYREMKAQEEAQANNLAEVEPVAQVDQSPVEPIEQPVQTEEPASPPPTEPVVETTAPTEPVASTPSVYDINGKQYSQSQIEEAIIVQSNLVDEQRKLEQEKERNNLQSQYFEAIQRNPAFAEEFAKTNNLPFMTPEQLRLKEMEDKYNTLMIRNELMELRAKHGNIDERAVLQYAVDRGLNRLDDAYNLMQLDNKVANPGSEAVDVENLTKQIRQEVLRELESKVDTGTIIGTRNAGQEVVDNTPKLSTQEARVAKMMGLTTTEYAKWRSVK